MNDLPESCLPFDDDLSALVDEELSAEREAQVREHLATCAGCARRLEALCDVDLTLAGLPAPEVPGDLGARLAARIAADGQGAAAPARPAATSSPVGRAPATRRRALAPRAAVWFAAAAALALAVWVAVRSEEGVAPPAPVAVTPSAPSQEALPAPDPPAPGPVVALEEPVAPVPPVAVQEPPVAPVVGEEPAPAPGPPAGEPPLQLADAGLLELADLEEADIALLLEFEAVQDLEVIANLDLLERFLALEERRGAG